MLEPDAQQPVRRRRFPWGTLLFVVLTVAGVLAALLLRPAPADHAGRTLEVPTTASAPAVQFDPRKPWEADVTAPGLVTLDKLPPDLDFPPEARRISLVQMRQAGLTQTKAEYFLPLSPPQARQRLFERLTPLGWQEATPATTPATNAGYALYKPGKTLSVRMYPQDGGTRIVAVVIEGN